jgi:tryptophanyl-tRNA synthetase
VGVAPTGPIHLGYLPHLLTLRRLQLAGAATVVLVANYHGHLDASKSAWEEIGARTAEYRNVLTRAGFGGQLVETSEFYGSEAYSRDLYRLSPRLSLATLRKAGHGTLGRADDDNLGNALYVATQILDPWFLQADLVLCGVDESPIYRLGLPTLQAATGFGCTGLYLPMCPGLHAAEMHASDAADNKILLFEDEPAVRAKLQAAPASTDRLTADEITHIIDSLGELSAALVDNDPAHKAAVYQRLGLSIRFNQDAQTAHAQVDLGMRRWEMVGVRGRTRLPIPSTPARSGCACADGHEPRRHHLRVAAAPA